MTALQGSPITVTAFFGTGAARSGGGAPCPSPHGTDALRNLRDRQQREKIVEPRVAIHPHSGHGTVLIVDVETLRATRLGARRVGQQSDAHR